MDPDYLPFHPNPKKPSYVPPPGSIDAHCHVFGPSDRFPYHPKRKYTPCDAPKEKLFELRDFLGFSRNVIVQASCHGSDNAALVDALEAAGEQVKGAVLASDGFFPFDDTVRLAASHGITAVIHPGGSMRDADSIKACDELGLTMMLTGRRHFLH